MLSFGFTESFLASHGCAVGHREKTFELAEPTYKKIAAVAHGIPICALCTDDGALGNNPRFRLVGRLQVIRTVCRLHSPVPVGRSNVKLSSLKCQDCLREGYFSTPIVLQGWQPSRCRRRVQVPLYLGVDEKSFAKRHRYETVICDAERGTVEYVVEDRSQESLEAYYRQFTPQELAQVRAVAMDMWDPYVAATQAWVPVADAKIVFDKFHVLQDRQRSRRPSSPAGTQEAESHRGRTAERHPAPLVGE